MPLLSSEPGTHSLSGRRTVAVQSEWTSVLRREACGKGQEVICSMCSSGPARGTHWSKTDMYSFMAVLSRQGESKLSASSSNSLVIQSMWETYIAQ